MKKYQDYVIRNGKLLGLFEKMYQDCKDPWHQSNISSPCYQLPLFLLRQYGIYPKKIADIGCGLGYFTAMIKNMFPRSTILAVDTSDTAIKKAISKHKNSGIVWQKLDISKSNLKGKYNLIILSQIMWYILPQFQKIVENLVRNNLNKGAYLLISQTFPRRNEQKYGKKYARGLEDILKMVPLKPLETMETSRLSDYNTISLFKKN